MTDIVERLRTLNADFLHEEAADEIERLRGERDTARAQAANADAQCERDAELVERLRKALRQVAHSAYYDSIYSPDGERHEMAIQIALDALGRDTAC